MAETATKPKVMVVAEQPIVADSLSAVLNQNGYEASSFYTGHAAVEWAKHSRPEIALSDFCLQRMNGIEAAMHIRSLQPGCRIILFSASHVNDSEEARILRSGFEFIPGPFQPKELLNRLRSAGRGRVIPFRRRVG